MKKTTSEKKTKEKPKPDLKLQVGEYARHATFNYILPYEFLLLCRLLDKTPDQMIYDFMVNAGGINLQSEGNLVSKEHLRNYLLAQGYGQYHYTESDIREMFKELDATGLLFPWNGGRKMIDLYSKWRNKYQRFWFKQWYHKVRRNPPKNPAQ